MNRQKSLPSRNPQDFKRGRMEYIRRNIQTGEGTGIVRGCGSYSAHGEDLTAKMTQTQESFSRLTVIYHATSRRCVLDSAPPAQADGFLLARTVPSSQHAAPRAGLLCRLSEHPASGTVEGYGCSRTAVEPDQHPYPQSSTSS